jgi:cytochrome c-type biogenesis protein CcmH/NrfG
MSTFVFLSALLLATAGLFIVPTLWRSAPAVGAEQGPAQRSVAVGLLFALTVLTAVLYAAVGQPGGLNAVASTSPTETETAQQASGQDAGQGPTPAQIQGMVNRLAQRLQAQPQDPAGWRMLARSYETLGRFDLAVQAYQRLLGLQAPDPDLLTDYAVTLGMSRDQTLVGEPEAVISEALKLNPRHVQALALSGSAAFERRDYARAVAQWQKLLDVVPKDAEVRASIERNMDKARALQTKDR